MGFMSDLLSTATCIEKVCNFIALYSFQWRLLSSIEKDFIRINLMKKPHASITKLLVVFFDSF